MSWATATATESRFRDTLVARARKRTVEGPFPGGNWIVHGDPGLGDSYERYLVQLLGEDPTCTCRSHGYGEYRPVCSHGVAALLRAEELGLPLDAAEPAGADGDVPAIPPAGASPVTAPPAPGLVSPPRDEAWGHPPLPEWLETIHAHQQQAVLDVERAWDQGAKVVILSAPTGTGKTLLAELARRRLGGQALYTCTTKTLQDQVLGDFPYAKLLKGRDNYPTGRFPERFTVQSGLRLSCGDCNWSSGKPQCTWCENKAVCPYEIAKGLALGADLAILNTSYFFAECNGPGKFRGRGLVILDEADLLEAQLMGYAELRVTRKWQERLGIGPPDVVTHTAKSAIPAWRRWAEEAAAKVTTERARYSDHDEDPRDVRARRHLDSLRRGLRLLADGLADAESPEWVYSADHTGAVVFRPVRVSQLGEQLLWRHGERFLLMSASVISPDEMVESLGFTGDWAVVDVPSTFPPERRPVYVAPVANVVNKQYDDSVPKLARAIERIGRAHPGDNILVHTVSYKLARDLAAHVQGSPHEVLTYGSAQERARALARFRHGSRPSLILAPSLDRGVDLPDDACRVVVVAKVPYPYLGDKQVSARLYSPGGQTWYRVQTVRSIVQMTGRAMRHKDDSSTSYLLDRQFMDLHKRSGHLIPSWWKDALRWEMPPWLQG